MSANVVEAMEKCGQQVAKHFPQLDEFCIAFGLALFKSRKIPSRITFLRKLNPITEIENIAIASTSDCVVLVDKSGSFRNLSIALFDNSEDGKVFSIRQFDSAPKEVMGAKIKSGEQTYVHACTVSDPHWNFTVSKSKLNIFPPSLAFYDLHKTRAASNLIVWASNVLGYSTSRKIALT